EKEEEEKNTFPILKLPAELSYKILSYMEKEELSVCLQSLILDKVHAEWSKDKRIEEIRMDMMGNETRISSERYLFKRDQWSSLHCISDRIQLLFNKCELEKLDIFFHYGCSVEYCRGLIELCKKIRRTNALSICGNQVFSRSLTDESLRDLMSNKKRVDIIGKSCERISAAGLFAVWKDLLDEKFDDLTIIVLKHVVTDLFDLIRTDGEKSSWDDRNLDPIKVRGQKDKQKKYKLSIRFYFKSSIRMFLVKN
ncbi:hypothetical protein PFISCL1PPCAC_21858, partial [Pristionchus fissidentatus]